MVESPFRKFKKDKVRMLSVQVYKGMLQVQGEIHQVKQRLSSAIIVKAEGKELDEEQLAFLADLGVADGQVAQTITHNAAFQTDDLDAYDYDCDDIFFAKAVLMANLSSCDSNLNKIAEDFGKCFVPQQELSAEQKFWLQSSDKNSEEPSISNTPVKIKVPSEVPKECSSLIKHSREHADTLWEIVESARALSPLYSNLDLACKYVQRIQEVLVNVRDTCPYLPRPSEKLVAVTLKNKDKKVRFADLVTSSSNTQKQVDSQC
ncbi:hypothetical protein Tco_0109830 [Tanacetum coccineum]